MPKAKASKTTSDSSGGGWPEKARKIAKASPLGRGQWSEPEGGFPDNLKELILNDKSTNIPGFKPFEDAKERGFTWVHNDGRTIREVLQTRSGPSDIWVDFRSKARKNRPDARIKKKK